MFLSGSVVYDKLCSALTNNSLVKGIKQASPFAQTLKLSSGFSLPFKPVCTKDDSLFVCWHVLQVLIIICLR